MELKAGRERDALVARHVMGWSRSNDGLGGAWWYDERGNKTIYGGGSSGQSTYKEFRPSTDIAAAWEVVEKMRIMVSPTLLNRWIAGVLKGVTGDGKRYYFDGTTAEADTAPLAICLAALKAVGYDE